MPKLSKQGRELLRILVGQLAAVVPGRPETYVTYKQVHDILGLPQLGETWGRSLQAQGLNALAEWTDAQGLPAITGIIVTQENRMPENGFFKMYKKSEFDLPWWEQQVTDTKGVDWQKYL